MRAGNRVAACLAALLLWRLTVGGSGADALTLLLRVTEGDDFSIDGGSCVAQNDRAVYDAPMLLEGSCSQKPVEVVLELRDVGTLAVIVVGGFVALMTAVTCVLVLSWMHYSGRPYETAEQPPLEDEPPKPWKTPNLHVDIPSKNEEPANPTEEDSGKQTPPVNPLGQGCFTGDRPFTVLGPGVNLNLKQPMILSPSGSSFIRGISIRESSSFIVYPRPPGDDDEFRAPVPRSEIDSKPPAPPASYPNISPFEDPSKWPDANIHKLYCSTEGPQLIYNIQVEPVYDGWSKEGGCGVVKECIYNDGALNHQAVVKSLRPHALLCEQRALKNEIMILTSIPPHPNIVHPFGFSLGTSPFIVLEFLPTTLHDLLKRHAKGCDGPNMPSSNGLTYRDIINIMLDVVSGLEHLHHYQIVHNDIKESNIMLNESLNAKIIDFGLAKQKSSGYSAAGGHGTFGYLPPQKRDGLEDRDDVYSLGIVMWNCITAGCDVSALTDRLQVKVGERCRSCGKDFGLPEPLTRLVHECWRFERGQRPRLAVIRDCLQKMGTQSWVDRKPIEDLAWAVSKS